MLIPMAFLEIGSFCDLDEYTTNRSTRMLEDELEIGGLYTYMMQLTHEQYLAAKQPVRVEEISRKAGLVSVKFAFLDQDLLPEHEAKEEIAHGIIHCDRDAVFTDLATGEDLSLTEAYIRDYFEEHFGDFLAAGDSVLVEA